MVRDPEAIQTVRHSNRYTLLKGRCKTKATFLGARELGYGISKEEELFDGRLLGREVNWSFGMARTVVVFAYGCHSLIHGPNISQ